jgi:hypothetical protein
MKGNSMSKIRILNLLACLGLGVGCGAFLGNNEDAVFVCLLFSCLMNTWAFILLPYELYVTKKELMDEMAYCKLDTDTLFNRYYDVKEQMENVNDRVKKITYDQPRGNKVKSVRKV